MTPSERERRIEAAASAWMGRVGQVWTVTNIAALLLDAADEAVPMVSEEWANSSEHPNWEAGWHAGQQRGESERWALQVRAERAERAAWEFEAQLKTERARREDTEAAARDFVRALTELAKELPYLGFEDMAAWARAVLDAHPSFSGEKGTER